MTDAARHAEERKKEEKKCGNPLLPSTKTAAEEHGESHCPFLVSLSVDAHGVKNCS